MADRLSILEYDDVLGEAALDAAKARVKAYNQVFKELSPDAAEDMTKKYYKDFLAKLKKAYPYENTSRDDLSAIKNYDSAKMADYLYQYGAFNSTAKSPTKYEHDLKAAEIFPLLQGVAKKNEDWMSMGTEKLKQFGINHGYNVKTKEGLASLLKDIGEQQVNYDRAKVAKELQDWPMYWPTKVVYPSMMQEAENAIMTGGDFDGADAVKMGLLDAGTNTAMLLAPSLKVASAPLANSMIGTGLQMGGEAARQGIKAGLSDNGQTFDIAPVLFAGASGATRPALVGGLQQKASQFEGETMKQFSRGLSKATRAGDPVAAEREALKKTLDMHNKLVSRVRVVDEAAQAFDKNATNTAKTEIYAQIANANKVPEISKLFGVPMNKNFTINTKKVLEQYDKNTVTTFGFDNGKAVLKVRPKSSVKANVKVGPDDIVINRKMEATLNPGAPVSGQGIQQGVGSMAAFPNHFELDASNDALYRSLFPQRHSELMAGTPRAFKVGLKAGEVASDLGGRFEPTFKLGADLVPKYKNDYKDEQWYKNMSVRSKKIIDEAFKKKEAEESEEE